MKINMQTCEELKGKFTFNIKVQDSKNGRYFNSHLVNQSYPTIGIAKWFLYSKLPIMLELITDEKFLYTWNIYKWSDNQTCEIVETYQNYYL